MSSIASVLNEHHYIGHSVLPHYLELEVFNMKSRFYFFVSDVDVSGTILKLLRAAEADDHWGMSVLMQLCGVCWRVTG